MKKIFIFALGFIFLPCAFSKNINFQIVQNASVQEKVFAISEVFEQALADFFFEAGHIVSNSPVFIKTDEKSDSAELKRVLIESNLGSMDFFVRVQIDYASDSAQNPKAYFLDFIKDVTWKNYDVSTGKLISSGSAEPSEIGKKENNETSVYNFASFVASKISSGLKKSK
ncbi:hypothetical protein [Treponema pectinovorum]|uniref:hypothetical protein n=1 Tax=Treponema pectinovorum TaxID=164 RepID=UPI0011C8D7FD|nr:hypothetical protein [Treponema pectinovorum]